MHRDESPLTVAKLVHVSPNYTAFGTCGNGALTRSLP